MSNDEQLDSLLEELCQQQITEQELEERAAKLADTKSVDELNDLPRLHRLELKRLLNERGSSERAAQIKD